MRWWQDYHGVIAKLGQDERDVVFGKLGFKRCQILSGSNVLGIAPYPLIAFAYDLTSVANGVDACSGSGEQSILWSSPLIGIPEAAVIFAAQVLNGVYDSICDE